MSGRLFRDFVSLKTEDISIIPRLLVGEVISRHNVVIIYNVVNSIPRLLVGEVISRLLSDNIKMVTTIPRLLVGEVISRLRTGLSRLIYTVYSPTTCRGGYFETL